MPHNTEGLDISAVKSCSGLLESGIRSTAREVSDLFLPAKLEEPFTLSIRTSWHFHRIRKTHGHHGSDTESINVRIQPHWKQKNVYWPDHMIAGADVENGNEDKQTATAIRKFGAGLTETGGPPIGQAAGWCGFDSVCNNAEG